MLWFRDTVEPRFYVHGLLSWNAYYIGILKHKTISQLTYIKWTWLLPCPKMP